MLTRMQIDDFQAHEQLRIKFDPHVTVIVGPTDAGKSSVIRALRWVALNQPRGDAFIRDTAERCVVRLWVGDDDVLVGRMKGNKNAYRLDKQEFVSFGSNVPEQIAEVLRLDELNFQSQHDAPFWFALTPGEVAKQLNAIVDLGAIDRAQKYVTSLRQKKRTEIELIKQSIEIAQNDFSALDYVDLLDMQLVFLENHERTLFNVRKQWMELVDLNEAVDAVRKDIVELPDMSSLHEVKAALDKDVQDLYALLELLRALRKAEADIVKLPDMTNLDELKAEVDATIQNANDLRESLVQIGQARKNVRYEKGELEKIQEEIAELGEYCPTCGQPWEGSHADTAEENHLGKHKVM